MRTLIKAPAFLTVGIATRFFTVSACFVLAATSCAGEQIKRSEVLAIARAYAEHAWVPSPANLLHGRDRSKVEVHTPDSSVANDPGKWTLNARNLGVPYKWGGFDTLKSFEAGVRAGKAAGDLYSSGKRRLGDTAVSGAAVGVDCSGFISRCWKLPKKYGTATLPELCNRLSSAAELRPGDILNVPGGHVVLFARWLNDAKTRAICYEAEPYSKVIAEEQDVPALIAAGFQPLRYREIRD